MTLKTYIQQLNSLIEENPEYAELDVIYAKDDEGNDFQPVSFEPSLGNYDCNGAFTQQSDFDQLYEADKFVNSVCIN